MAEWNRGKPWSLDVRQKISLSEKGKVVPPEVRQKMSLSHMGRFVSPETRERLSNANKGKVFSSTHRANLSANHVDISGLNNPRWQGGKSFEDYGSAFNNELREAIRRRDDWICQDCGIGQVELRSFLKQLDIHHDDGNKHNNGSENLITLCRSCHQKRHGVSLPARAGQF